MKLLKALTFCGWPILLLPLILYSLGVSMNEIAVYANHKMMPFVWPRVCTADVENINHQCMTAQSHVKWLADWIISNSGVSSLGDFLEDAAQSLQMDCRIFWVGIMIYFGFSPNQKGKFWIE